MVLVRQKKRKEKFGSLWKSLWFDSLVNDGQWEISYNLCFRRFIKFKEMDILWNYFKKIKISKKKNWLISW